MLLFWLCFLTSLHSPAHASSVSAPVHCERAGVRSLPPRLRPGRATCGAGCGAFLLPGPLTPSPACRPHRQVRPPFPLTALVWNGLALRPELTVNHWPPPVGSCQGPVKGGTVSLANEQAGGVQRPLGAVGHPAVALTVPSRHVAPFGGSGTGVGSQSLLAVGTWGVTASGPWSGVGQAPTAGV